MATQKKSIIKSKRKAIAVRVKSRQKVTVKKNDELKAAKKKPSIKVSVGRPSIAQPRQRNAIGAIRVVEAAPAGVSQTNNTKISRPQALHKALYENASEDYDAPWVQLDPEEPIEVVTGRNRTRMLQTIFIACLLLGIFNSSALLSWVRRLPAGPVEDRIIISTETWHEWMEGQGVSDYIQNVRKYVQFLKETSWHNL